jgi:hypothetical protein
MSERKMYSGWLPIFSAVFVVPRTCVQSSERQVQKLSRLRSPVERTAGSEDCHGRALWALGTVLGRSKAKD